MPTEDAAESADSAASATPTRQLDDVHFFEIGERLILLGEILRDIGKIIENDDLHAAHESLQLSWTTYDDATEVTQQSISALRRTLANLGSFRKDYSNWERLIVEYALKHYSFTQRDVARLLGVGLSTVNRWAQNPLMVDDD